MTVIRAELGEANAAYQAAVATQPETVWRPLSDRVKALQQELSAAIAAGAVPCSRCGLPPLGLRHVHASKGKGGVVWHHTFEVGCGACPDTKADDRRGFAETPREESGADLDRHGEAARAAAVAKWNAKNTPRE